MPKLNETCKIYETNELIGKEEKRKQEEERVKHENEKNASGAYVPPDLNQLSEDGHESGLPWGSWNFGYMMSTGNETKMSSSSQQGAVGNTDKTADKEKEESSTKEEEGTEK
jgi:hypothetical protein